jgi:soluble lytic murein transglycosylase
LPKAEHYAFIKALRAIGLHDDALAEGGDFLSRYPGDDKTAAVLLLKAASLYILRRNDASIATVELMRRRYPRSPHTPDAAIIAIKCLRRSDNTMAIRGWVDWTIQTYPRSPVAAQALFELGVYLGNVVSEAEGIQVLQRLFQPGNQSFPLLDDALWKIAWMQRRLGRTEEAVTTLEHLLRDYPTSGFRKAALYWVARWDADRAADYYQILLREFPNDYYGHLALENLLNRDIKPRQVGTSKPFPPIDLLDKRETSPDAPTAYIKAIQLKQIGLYEFAAAELASLPNVEHDSGLQLALADLYARAGNSDQAFDIVQKHFREFIVAGSQDRNRIPVEFWRIVYPFNHRAEIEQALKEAKLATTRIDPYLIAALIRMESRFQTNAISKAGAIGLMQLLPETAERTATQAGLGRVTRGDLFNPATNIRLGILYLAQRVKDFDGDWFPAICSYNGGVGPVRQWWGNKPPDQPLDEFIENIPYLETRLYIKQILGDYHNYERLYAESAG